MVIVADPLHCLHHAAYLNEQGCALMESGKQHEAFETFIAALDSVSTLTHAIESNAHEQRAPLSLQPRRKQPCASLQASSCILCDDSRASSYCTANQLDHNFVYNQAFRFTAPQDVAFLFGGCGNAAYYIKLYRAILAFNSALSFHQRSIGAMESVKRKAETVASDLYMDALNLLGDCDATLDVCRVMAATMNNDAMLFYEMQEFVKFEGFQAELYLLLVDMETSFPRSVDRHCLQCLFFNAKLLSPPTIAAAA